MTRASAGQTTRSRASIPNFCSAFVLHLFRSAGVDLLPGLAEKTAAPEDLFRSPLPHTAYLLVRRRVTLATGTAMRRVRVGLKRALRSRPRGKQEA